MLPSLDEIKNWQDNDGVAAEKERQRQKQEDEEKRAREFESDCQKAMLKVREAITEKCKRYPTADVATVPRPCNSMVEAWLLDEINKTPGYLAEFYHGSHLISGGRQSYTELWVRFGLTEELKAEYQASKR